MLFLTIDARVIDLPSVARCSIRDRKIRCYDNDGQLIQTLAAAAIFIYGTGDLYMNHAAELLREESRRDVAIKGLARDAAPVADSALVSGNYCL